MLSRPARLLLLGAVLSGCVAPPQPAGRDYRQSAVGSFILNETTVAQAEAVLGPPVRQSTLRGIAKPNSTLVAPGTPLQVTTLNYFFAPLGTGTRGPHPFKSGLFVFLADRLVAYDLKNSIQGEVTAPIDEGQLTGLHQGRTTRDEVIALFGTPISQRLHVLDAQAGTSEIAYGWMRRHEGTVESRILHVYFDRAARMSSYAILDNSYPVNGSPIPFAPVPALPGAPNAPVPHLTHPAPDLEHT